MCYKWTTASQSVCRHIVGDFGRWLFHSSNRGCESFQIHYGYRCLNWYIREIQSRFYHYYYHVSSFYYHYSYYYFYYRLYWNPFRWLRPCPCWYWQATWDWRYSVDSFSRCATFNWGTRTQVVEID